MRCPRCKHNIPPTDKFCVYCGLEQGRARVTPEAGIHIPMPRRIALAGLLAVCVVAGALVAPTVHAQTAAPRTCGCRATRTTTAGSAWCCPRPGVLDHPAEMSTAADVVAEGTPGHQMDPFQRA